MWLAAEPHVTLVAEPVFHLGPLAVRNSMVLGALGTVLVFGIFAYTVKRVAAKRYNRFSVAVLWVFELLLGTVEEAMGSQEEARRVAPLAITMFFFILINNWIELLPFVGPVTWNGLPLFRGLAADLNFTLALAIITMVTAQIWAIRSLGFRGNLGRYFANPFHDPGKAMEGLLDIVAEFSRLIALAMRLFGNIFGGEVLLAVMSFISAWAAPLTLVPFMALELFVGTIQAYVFFMLTTVFIALGSAHQATEPKPAPAREVMAGSANA